MRDPLEQKRSLIFNAGDDAKAVVTRLIRDRTVRCDFSNGFFQFLSASRKTVALDYSERVFLTSGSS